MIGSYSYEEVVDYLSNVLVNERKYCHYYTEKRFKFIGKTLVLFKYRSKLIGKAIFTSLIEESKDFGLKHCLGYFSIEPDSIEIFNEEIDLEKLNKYFPHITNMLTDRLFDLDSSNKFYEMIDDYT